MLRLNESQLQPEMFRAQFEQHGKCRVKEFWQADSARQITETIAQMPFSMAYNLNGQNREAGEAELARLDASVQKELLQNIHAGAAKGHGFLYGRSKVTEQQDAGLISHVLRVMNSDKILNFVRDLSGEASIVASDAHVTRFSPGNFLTRHSDNVVSEGRRVAYVLGFSEQWHPDWGGLLQFYRQDGQPLDAWAPQFNTLTLFDVKHIHAVTCIAPFAPKNRYSITGWFKNKVV